MQDSGSVHGESQWDLYVDTLRAKLPVAPTSLMNGYVRWAPWVAIIFGAIGVLVFLFVTLLGAALTPFLMFGGAAAVRAGGALLVAALIGIVGGVLDIVGGYLMLQRRLLGWWILGLGIAISLVTNLLQVAILSLVILLLVAYIHIEVKPYYQ
jgi:hypothetical protein